MPIRTVTRHRAVRRWGAAVAVVGGLVVTVPTADAVDSGLPAGLVWVGRPPAAETSTLYRAGADGTVRRQRLPWSLNAIGCAPDGSVYGLAAGRHGERFRDGPHPVRVRPDGTVDDLGPVTADARYPLSSGHAAALRAGPGETLTLVVASAGILREVRLRPGPPRLTASRPLPDAATTSIGDWAVDARGDLVTVTGADGRAVLLRLAGPTLRPVRTRVAGLPKGSNYGGAAAAGDGSLYVVHHRASGRGTIYRVPPSGTARRVSTVDPAESSDATMCPEPRRVPEPPSSVPSSVSPAPVVPVVVPPATRAAPRRQAVGTPVSSEEPTGPAPGPRPGAATRPRPRTAVAPPPRDPLVTTRVIPVMGAVLLGAVVAVRLIRRRG